MNLNVFFSCETYPFGHQKKRAVNPIKVFFWGKNGTKSSYLERKKSRNQQI